MLGRFFELSEPSAASSVKWGIHCLWELLVEVSEARLIKTHPAQMSTALLWGKGQQL